MKSITVYFEDSEFEDLKNIKLEMTWHDFIMLATKKNEINENKKGG